MNAEEIKQFLENLKDTDIEELRLESGEKKIFFRKSDVPSSEIAVQSIKEKKAVQEESKIKLIKAPMVGTFYHSRSSDHPPFVVDGENIVPGQKVGIMETMKIIKDVTSNLRGKIVKVSVKNGQSVEYGQELFQVDTGDIQKTGSEKN